MKLPRLAHLMCDNKSALAIVDNPIAHEPTKHVDVDRHFIKDEVEQGIIQPLFVSTGDQLADIFTMELAGLARLKLVGNLGMSNIHT